ncbi:tripartite tricarboxylate transporter substrate binding protein [Azospirillum griseum]|uniref:Tripartite tricarboxylate transporter substrate binding protein n=1 Tax=Azospirillum griseum TaxID=2496639 RepID=A0A431VBV6_9PROT|nr:tripartite tricarboxylate transporter substrate binding protein [Azospirillum griseum]RTR16132.1 tripartite tricarboxylate transporter substrate binding protein [Azospirillum griseum]
MRDRLRRMVLLIGALASLPLAARAEYPDHPITMIVAYGAGGQTDITARSLAPFIEKHLGNGARVITVNKPGAGGEIGFAALADAKPDGYTIGFINTPTIQTIPIERRARFTLDRLTPLVNIIEDPGVIIVRNDSPYKTLSDLVNHAKANPLKVSIASTGVGSDDHLAILALQRQSKAQFLHIPFTTSIDNYRSMLNGNTAASATNIAEALRGVQSDPVRVLGIMATARSPMAPSVPTFQELGYNIVMGSMRGLAAPQGLPDEIKTKLVDAIFKAANDPGFRKVAEETFQPLHILEPNEFTVELHRGDDEFRQLWTEAPWLAR